MSSHKGKGILLYPLRMASLFAIIPGCNQSPLAIRVICSVELSLGHQVQKLRYRHMYKPFLRGYWWLGVGQRKLMGKRSTSFPRVQVGPQPAPNDQNGLQSMQTDLCQSLLRMSIFVCSLYTEPKRNCCCECTLNNSSSLLSLVNPSLTGFQTRWRPVPWVGVVNGGVLNVGSKSFVPQGEAGSCEFPPNFMAFCQEWHLR